MNANNLLAAARCPGVPPLLLVQAGAGLAGGIFQSTFSLVLQQQYKLTSKESGMVLSYVGGCIVFGEFRTHEPKRVRLQAIGNADSFPMAATRTPQIELMAECGQTAIWPARMAEYDLILLASSRMTCRECSACAHHSHGI
jgi:hypothetical protein